MKKSIKITYAKVIDINNNNIVLKCLIDKTKNNPIFEKKIFDIKCFKNMNLQINDFIKIFIYTKTGERLYRYKKINIKIHKQIKKIFNSDVTMLNINGIKLSKLPFTLTKLGNLEYYEGCLLSHFIDLNTQTQYLYEWCNSDMECNRWMIFKVTNESLLKFFNKEITLRELILNNHSIYFIDLYDNLLERQVLITTISNIPENYLPLTNSYFNDLDYEEYAINLYKQLLNS